MDKTEASKISGLMMDYWHAELAADPALKDSPSHHHIAERADKTVYHAALDFLPAGATAALIEMGEDDVPTIVAVKGQQLYLLSLENVTDLDADIYANFRSTYIEAGSGTVDLRARFRDQHNEGASPRSNEWRFTLRDGTEIDIPNRYRPDIGPDTRESVAWALAKALGFDLPAAQPEPMVAVIG